jgi:hypothetical protein
MTKILRFKIKLDLKRKKCGLDFAGINKMYGATYTSDIIEKTKMHIV